MSQLRAALDIAKAKLKARLEQLAADRKDFLNSAEALFDLSVAGQLKSASTAAKFTALLLVAASCVAGARAAGAPEQSSRLIIGITDHPNLVEREFTETAIDGILLTNGWNGTVEVFDAGRCEKIGGFFVANDSRSAVAKLRQNARFISALHTFLHRDTNNCDGHILIPQFTEFVGTHLRQAGEHTVLWLIGSERYSSTELGYNMASNLVPSIDHVFASEKTSVFGTLEKSNLLAGVEVHLIYREDDFLSKFHADALADFWNVFLTQQGAKVISNSSEFETVLDRILRGISEPYKVVTPEPIGRITMLAVIGDKLIPVENTTPDAPAVDTSNLKRQIEDKDRQLKLAESQAATATALKAQLGSATRKIADLANAADQADSQSARLTAELAAADQLQIQAVAQARYDALIAAGDSIEPLASKLVPYEQAVAVAVSNQIDPATALGRLQSVRSKLAPVSLPAGVTAELTRISLDDYPPCLALDLAIEDSGGQPVLGLTDKDFTVLFGGERAAVRTAYVPKPAESQIPINLLIALDCSGSMEHALPQAKAAISSMLAAFRDRSNFHAKILSFNSSVNLRCDWTTNIDTAAQSVTGLTASGSTALYKAIGEGISSLAGQPGDRRLVVLTDGGDNKGGPYSPASLGAAMKTDDILSYFIGLKTADLDKKDLSKIAALSGGFFSMADAEDLSAVFGDATERLGRQTYRLVVLPKELPSSQSPLLGLMVGGGQTTITVETNISVPVSVGPTAFNK